MVGLGRRCVNRGGAGRADRHGAGAEWRDGHHDDLVPALALARWRGEHGVQPRLWQETARVGALLTPGRAVTRRTARESR